MKKIFIFIVIVVLAIPLNAQQTQANLDYLKRAKKVFNTGTTLTLTGIGTTICGAVMFSTGSDHPSSSNPYETKETYTTRLGVVGLILMPVGVIIFAIGVPIFIVGCILKGQAKRNLQLTLVNFKSPTNCASINGIGITLRF